MADQEKDKKLTVFASDRHEDWASIIATAIVVISVLAYMAFVIPSVDLKSPSDGKILELKTAENKMVKKGDTLYQIEVKEKKYVHGAIQEKTVKKDIKSKSGGKVLKVNVKPGEEVKKGKSVIVLAHDKGTLP